MNHPGPGQRGSGGLDPDSRPDADALLPDEDGITLRGCPVASGRTTRAERRRAWARGACSPLLQFCAVPVLPGGYDLPE